MPADQSNLFVSGSALYLTGFEGELFDEIDFSTDMTSVTITAAGTTVIMKGDGSTPKATIRGSLTSYGANIAAGWSVVCNASNSSPIQLKDVLSSVANSFAAPMFVLDPVWSKEPNWDTDRWFLEVIFNGISLPASHATYMDAAYPGIVPSGSAPTYDPGLKDLGGRQYTYAKDISGTYSGGQWESRLFAAAGFDNQTITTTGPVISSSMSLLFDSFRNRMALKLGATDYTSGSLLPNGDWNFDTIGKDPVTLSITGAGDFTNGPALVFYIGTKRNSGDKLSFGIKKIRLYVAVPNSRTQVQ